MLSGGWVFVGAPLDIFKCVGLSGALKGLILQ